MTIRKHPMTDDLVCKAGAEILRRHKPNLLMLHPANIDGARHAWGLFNGHVDQAVRETDAWLGLLMQAARDAGIYENTDFVVLSDHGQMDIVRVMCLNVKLREAGLIRTNADGSFADWDAYVKSCGMSAHVYVKNKADEPRVRPGAVLERCDLVDDAPTLAAMLGLRLPEAQGRVLTELLR